MLCPDCRSENDVGAEACFKCGRSLDLLTRGSLLAGRYEIRRLLGKGGMGIVYQAWDRVLDEAVAIKVLRLDLAANPEVAKRFRSEIKLARRVSHPNVCRIHTYAEDGGLGYISMAFVEGTDVKELLRQKATGLPPEEAFPIVLQLAEGLGAIHDAGVLHRDLKTPNIMRDTRGLVRILDFGIAKAQDADPRAHLTATGKVIGTPEYMSPEQCRGEPLDARSDVYAAGIVTFEVFTGQLPFQGPTLVATLFKQLREEPPWDSPAGRRLPKPLVPVLRRALAKRPEERYATAGEMLAALRAAQREVLERPAAPHPAPEPAPAAARARVGRTPSRVALRAAERRRAPRLRVPLDVVVSRLDAAGSQVRPERTVVEDLSRRGASVLTAQADVADHEVLLVEEVGGDFKSRAAVRNQHLGADGVRRLGLEFLDRGLPERLLPVETPLPRPRRAAASDAPHGRPERRTHPRLKLHLDVILRRRNAGGIVVYEQRTVTEDLGREGARLLTSLTALDVGDVIEVAEATGDFQTRAVVRNRQFGHDKMLRLGVKFLDRSAPDRLVGSEPAPEPAPARRVKPDPLQSQSGFEQALARARALHESGRHWDAVQALEPALPLAQTPSQRQLGRLLLARAALKDPRGATRAEELLREVVDEQPDHWEALFLLAGIYRAGGLKARALRLYRRVLELNPGHAEARAELESLEASPGRR